MKKIALISGATSGIGEACARKFAEGGYNLILTGRRENKLIQIKDPYLAPEMGNIINDVERLCLAHVELVLVSPAPFK